MFPNVQIKQKHITLEYNNELTTMNKQGRV